MDAEGIKIIGDLLLYFAGIIATAFLWEVIRAALYGAVLLYVLRRAMKG